MLGTTYSGRKDVRHVERSETPPGFGIVLHSGDPSLCSGRPPVVAKTDVMANVVRHLPDLALCYIQGIPRYAQDD